MDTTIVSFPGLGIGEMTINQVAFAFGPFEVRWYGLIITLGMVLGFLYAVWRGKSEGVSFDDLVDFALLTIVMAIIGARAYYVLTTLGEGYYTSFRDVIAIWEGGIAIYGGLIGGAAALLIVSKLKKYSKNKLLKVFDMVAPGAMLGQILGRWGNFVNGEAHGIETAENFFLRMGLRYGSFTYYFHPTFLYESLWNLVGFVLINLVYKKKKFDGQILLMYLGWYGLGRMFIEGLRTDSLYIGEFRISQVVGFLCFTVCTALLVYLLVRARRAELDTAEYTSVYEGARHGKRPTAERERVRAEGKADVEAIIARAEETQKKENEDGKVD